MAYGSDSAWILGGIVSEWVAPAPGSPVTPIPGMIQFDMASRSFSNSSVQCCNAIGSIYKGAPQYVPSLGPEGIYIAMGGQNELGDIDAAAGLIDFGTVSVFDPAKQEWWNQTTTGSAPSPRIEFCTAGTNSTNGTYEMLDDHSRWNSIYLFDADDLLDSFLRAGAPMLVQKLFHMTQSIFLPYQHSTGSASSTTPRTLDMHSLAMLLGEVRYSLLVDLTRTRTLPRVRFMILLKALSIAHQTRLRRA